MDEDIPPTATIAIVLLLLIAIVYIAVLCIDYNHGVMETCLSSHSQDYCYSQLNP